MQKLERNSNLILAKKYCLVWFEKKRKVINQEKKKGKVGSSLGLTYFVGDQFPFAWSLLFSDNKAETDFAFVDLIGFRNKS